MTAAMAREIDDELERVVDEVARRAAALDADQTDVRVDIAALGAQGLFHAGGVGTDLAPMVRTIERVATGSLAVGFSAWAHRMAIEYVSLAAADCLRSTRSPNQAYRGRCSSRTQRDLSQARRLFEAGRHGGGSATSVVPLRT
ncbi:membrane protein [Mycobacteroides abscessus]|nr:membrane protein [Mycobacteroides abscessus]